MSRSASHGGRALLALGALAVVRAWLSSNPPVSAGDVGTPILLRIEDLSGDEFRLLPGVGPVLAGRLEAARLAAGGRLSPERLRDVTGVGPTLMARWAALRPDVTLSGPGEARPASPLPAPFR